MVPGPERTLIVFAYSEFTQKFNKSNGWFVAEAVKVGLGVGVSVMVDESVIVGLAVGLMVGESVSVNVRTGVVEGTRVAVGLGVLGGVNTNVDSSASTIRIPIKSGIAYLRSSSGNVVGVTGSSPLYPSVSSKALRLPA